MAEIRLLSYLKTKMLSRIAFHIMLNQNQLELEPELEPALESELKTELESDLKQEPSFE